MATSTNERDLATLDREADLVRPYLKDIRVPSPAAGDKIYKDECVYSFDTPLVDLGEDPARGLYVCLKTFRGVGQHFVPLHSDLTGSHVFLHLRRVRIPVETEGNATADQNEKPKPTRLAIGLEGGFAADPDAQKYRYEDENSLLVLSGADSKQWAEIRLPNEQLPELVLQSVKIILEASSAGKLEDLQATAGTWDGEARATSKHADNLLQLDNGVKILPGGWQCAKCDKRDNLWLNLTDGTILCGRKFFDGTGGNNHAVEHYQATQYPLSVKLGTITGEGADVYSYAEDDMVIDPYLDVHLAHFGINMSSMQKTEKTMVEMEIDLNSKVNEWAVIQEEGKPLEPLFGPGYTGLTNLGNSCYMNSVLQVLFSIPEFSRPFAASPEEVYRRYNKDPTQDIGQQLTKLAYGLLSGRYSIKPPNLKQDPATGQWMVDDGDQATGGHARKPSEASSKGVRPAMLKALVGRGHPEFSTKHQQDAQEFFLHLLQLLERNARNQPELSTPGPLQFKFLVEERVQCSASSRVAYRTRTDFLLSLPIPMSALKNPHEVQEYEERVKKAAAEGLSPPTERIRPLIPLMSCIESFAAEETIEDFFSSAINGKTTALKRTRLRTFPNYLMIQLKKFTIGDDWTPKKLDVAIEVPDELDLSFLRGSGLQSGERELPDIPRNETATGPSPAAAAVQIDESIVNQLTTMGFSMNGCRRAVLATQNTGAEAAMNWVFEHMNDPDFNDPLPSATPTSSASSAAAAAAAAASKDVVIVDEAAVENIMSMGFTREQASHALRQTNNNTERAVDWIFSHPDELNAPLDPPEATAAAPPNDANSGASSLLTDGLDDGPGRYQLMAFISHMGTSTACGHYVAHILKDGRWTIFNDEKVAVSERPPRELAYLYLYQRMRE